MALVFLSTVKCQNWEFRHEVGHLKTNLVYLNVSIRMESQEVQESANM